MRIRILFIVLTLLTCPASAFANPCLTGCPRTIDDFEEGPMNLSGPGAYTYSGLPQQSCLFTQRIVRISGDNVNVNTIPVYPSDRLFTAQNSLDFTTVTLAYESLVEYDLTDGGRNDRFILELYDSASVLNLTIAVDGYHIQVDPARLIIGSVDVLFSEFSNSSGFESVRDLEFRFQLSAGPGLDHVQLRRILVSGSVSSLLLWDVPVLSEVGPPFPLPGPDIVSFRDVGGNPFPTGFVAAGVNLALNLDEGSMLTLQMTTGATGPNPGDLSPALGWELSAPSVEQDGFPDLMWEFVLFPLGPSGQDPVELQPPPTPNEPQDGVLYVPYDIWHETTPGTLEFQRHRLRVEIPPDPIYEFSSAELFAPAPGAGTWGVGLRVSMSHTGVTPKASTTDVVLVQLQLEGEWLPGDVTTAAPRGVQPLQSLTAAPSVMSHRTQLSWSQPVGAGATLEVYDLRGRAVRRLLLDTGATSMHWNGRDRGGRPVSSGVYLLRLQSSQSAATGRITVLR